MERLRAGARSVEAQLHSQIIGAVVQLLYLYGQTRGVEADIATGVCLSVSAEGVRLVDDGIQRHD
jgi:hypothetical protein